MRDTLLEAKISYFRLCKFPGGGPIILPNVTHVDGRLKIRNPSALEPFQQSKRR